jgi:hypothetical protein
MIAILYRWRIKPEFEKQFIESWSETTEYYMRNFGALGSRLHKSNDGLWYAYAQWKSFADRDLAFKDRPNLNSRDKMRETIEESFPEVLLEIKADFLIFPEK